MPNYILSYDLNGQRPTHAEMDAHLKKACRNYARILETVWYVGHPGSLTDITDYVKKFLSDNDLLIVVEAKDASWTKLLVGKEWLIAAWNQNR